jgi:hypothetical protein
VGESILTLELVLRRIDDEMFGRALSSSFVDELLGSSFWRDMLYMAIKMLAE